MANLKTLNNIAKKDDLELINGKGYFYWWGLSEEMQLKCAGLYTTSVYVNRFADLPFDRWLDELKEIKEKIKNAETDENRFSDWRD